MCSINHDLKAIFIHIPKTAGTYIANHLDEYYGFKTYLKDLETGTRINPNVPMQGNMQAPFAGQAPKVVDFNSLPTGAR